MKKKDPANDLVDKFMDIEKKQDLENKELNQIRSEKNKKLKLIDKKVNL